MQLLSLNGFSRRTPFILLALLLLCSLPLAVWAQERDIRESARADMNRADDGVTRRAALVIGNTNYQHKPLKNPANDARDMAAALSKLGFRVTLKQDLTLVRMRETINEWADGLDDHTLALVYYSGHGVTNDGQNYLVPVNNAAITHKRDVPDMAYPFQRMLQATKDAGCPLRIFILDACRNDPLPKSLKGEDSTGGLVKVAAPTGAFIAYAAASGEMASDNREGNNGLYTAALIKNITTPGLSIESLFKKVLSEVRHASDDEQHPDVSSQLEGEFCFAGTINHSGGAEHSASVAPAPKTTSATDFAARGDESYDAGKYDTAVSYYTIAIEADSKNSYVYYRRGFAYNQLEQFDKAVADCTNAIQRRLGYAAAYAERGYAYNRLDQFDKAIMDCGEAIKFKPDYSYAYAERGYAYNGLDQFDKAIADLTKAIKLKPTYDFAYAERGCAYNGLKQFDKAIADETEAIRLEPDDSYAYVERGDAYDSLNQYDKAIVDYNEAIRLNPSDAYTYYSRGFVYKELHQYGKVVTDQTEAIRLKPDYADAYLERGLAYYHLHRWDKALADYRRRAQLSPNDGPDWLSKRITDLENKVE